MAKFTYSWTLPKRIPKGVRNTNIVQDILTLARSTFFLVKQQRAVLDNVISQVLFWKNWHGHYQKRIWPSGSAVVTDLSSCHHAVAWQLFQAVVRQLKCSDQTVIRLTSDRHAVVMSWSGSHHAVVWQLF